MPQRKLTWEQACAIRAREDTPGPVLAKEYGVSYATIRAVRRGIAHTHPPKVARRQPQKGPSHICRDCGRTPSETPFSRARERASGFVSYCKVCQHRRFAVWYASNRERKRATQRIYARKKSAMSTSDAAQALGVSAKTIIAWVRNGILPGYHAGSRNELAIPKKAISTLQEIRGGLRKLTPNLLEAYNADMLTPRQAASTLAVSRQRIYQLIQDGKLPAIRSRCGYIIHTDDVAKRLVAHT